MGAFNAAMAGKSAVGETEQLMQVAESQQTAVEVVIEVWPENYLAWSVFTKFDDQWRMGMGGPIALDIVPVQHELARLGLTGDEYDDTFACVRVAANAALEEILRKDD